MSYAKKILLVKDFASLLAKTVFFAFNLFIKSRQFD